MALTWGVIGKELFEVMAEQVVDCLVERGTSVSWARSVSRARVWIKNGKRWDAGKLSIAGCRLRLASSCRMELVAAVGAEVWAVARAVVGGEVPQAAQ